MIKHEIARPVRVEGNRRGAVKIVDGEGWAVCTFCSELTVFEALSYAAEIVELLNGKPVEDEKC